MSYSIRLVEPADNPELKTLVQSVLGEFGCVGPGFASSDPELDRMYETYQVPGSRYWVIVDNETQQIMGGGGFCRLKGTSEEEGICELQKYYFYPELRGQGLGKRLLQQVVDAAQESGYQEMYLETVPQMASAIHLYERLGFSRLDCHKGNTGHHERCTVRMSRLLEPSGNPLPV
jgi:putative acetyltransferase